MILNDKIHNHNLFIQGTPDDQLNPKKKVWEAVQPDLLINAEGLATYKGAPWMITSKGTCKAPSMTNVGIK